MGGLDSVILLDTSALLQWSLDRAQLSQSARLAIQQADRICVSSISFWEVALKAKAGKLLLPFTPREFLRRFESIDATQILPVTELVWLESVELDWKHRDPADRVIVATASMHGCPLAASDSEIRSFYPKTVW
jgi:PIN domain nuclease of toxin-antitoxin system